MTSEELRNPALATKPLDPITWLLRIMVLFPERICDPKDLAEWKAAHTPEAIAEAKQFRAGDKRNNYGVTGRRR